MLSHSSCVVSTPVRGEGKRNASERSARIVSQECREGGGVGGSGSTRRIRGWATQATVWQRTRPRDERTVDVLPRPGTWACWGLRLAAKHATVVFRVDKGAPRRWARVSMLPNRDPRRVRSRSPDPARPVADIPLNLFFFPFLRTLYFLALSFAAVRSADVLRRCSVYAKRK